MLEELNYEGKWWLANRPDYSLPGSLTFSQKTGAILSLIGSFDLIGEKVSSHDIIIGESSEGKKVTPCWNHIQLSIFIHEELEKDISSYLYTSDNQLSIMCNPNK